MRCFNKQLTLQKFTQYLHSNFIRCSASKCGNSDIDFSTEKWHYKDRPIILKIIYVNDSVMDNDDPDGMDKHSYIWYPKRLRGINIYDLIRMGYEEADYQNFFGEWKNHISLGDWYYGKDRNN